MRIPCSSACCRRVTPTGHPAGGGTHALAATVTRATIGNALSSRDLQRRAGPERPYVQPAVPSDVTSVGGRRAANEWSDVRVTGPPLHPEPPLAVRRRAERPCPHRRTVEQTTDEMSQKS